MGKERFVKKKQTVLEAEKSKVFCKGERREDFADMWSSTGTILLIGLAGSRREEFGRELASRLTLPFYRAGSMKALEQFCSAGGCVVVVENAVLQDAQSLSFVHAAGKVFYLMAEVETLAGRLMASEGFLQKDAALKHCVTQLALMEPFFMKALHFIIQPSENIQEMVNDAMEKVAW